MYFDGESAGCKKQEESALLLKDCKQILEMRERELDRVYEANDQLLSLVRELEQKKDYWQTRFYEIQNSTCWRMTKGVRFLAGWMRRR